MQLWRSAEDREEELANLSTVQLNLSNYLKTKNGTDFPTGKVVDMNYNDIIYDFGKNITRPSLYTLSGNKCKNVLQELKKINVPASLIEKLQLVFSPISNEE